MKAFFHFVLAMLFVTGATAQNFYVKAGLGYAFAQGGQTQNENTNPYNGSYSVSRYTIYDTSFSMKKASFSTGFQGIMGIGYTLGPHIAVELNAGIGIASKKYTDKLDSVLDGTGSYSVNATETRQASSTFLLMPCLVIQSGGKDVNLYMRAGIVLPFSSKIKIEEHSVSNDATMQQEDMTGTLITNFNIGYTGAVGARFTVNKKINIWAECNLLSLSLTASEFDVATHTLDNSTATTFPAPGTVIHYKTSGTISATDRMTYSIPYSNIGISAGVTYSFIK